MARPTGVASAISVNCGSQPAVALEPPLTFASRETVDGARSSFLAIARNESPHPRPREIVSRSAKLVRFKNHTVGSAGRFLLDMFTIRLTSGWAGRLLC